MNVTVGAAIAAHLRAHEVDTVFGIPGVHNVELYRGLRDADLRHVLVRHEQGAGFMADGFARATGRPGVCFVITGPGLLNILTPMGQAYSDSQPMLVISSVLERRDVGKGRGRLHEMKDQEGAAATVCEWSATADDPASAFELIDRAFAGFATARQRPVHIQVPLDVLAARIDRPGAPHRALRPGTAPGEAVARVADALAGARRPLLIVGGGTVEAGPQVTALVERLRVPAFATVAGKGVLDDGHPLAFGAGLPRPESAEIVAGADLVLALGTELAETDLWRDRLDVGGTLARVDLDPHVLADRHGADLAVMGDVGEFLDALLSAVDDRAGASVWTSAEVADHRARLRRLAASERPGIAPALEVIRQALPRDAVVASDMTEIAYLGNELYDAPRPRSWLHPVGFGTLGYALPAAIGAKLARPDAPVAALAGDFGFHYTMQELGVAVEHRLALPVLLWDNDRLRAIEQAMQRSQIEPTAVQVLNPDFLRLAEAFGAAAAAPASLDAIGTEIERALERQCPTLIRITPAAAGA